MPRNRAAELVAEYHALGFPSSFCPPFQGSASEPPILLTYETALNVIRRLRKSRGDPAEVAALGDGLVSHVLLCRQSCELHVSWSGAVVALDSGRLCDIGRILTDRYMRAGGSAKALTEHPLYHRQASTVPSASADALASLMEEGQLRPPRETRTTGNSPTLAPAEIPPEIAEALNGPDGVPCGNCGGTTRYDSLNDHFICNAGCPIE